MMLMTIPPGDVNPSRVLRLFRGSELQLRHQNSSRVGLQPLRKLLLPSLVPNLSKGTTFPLLETKSR